jgi:hypothetical protein
LFCGSYGGSQARSAATDDYNVMSKHFELYYMLIR